ncbi:hypothetical protein TCAL_00346 [Tigriopus californicus]|uniref:WD repeat-containing protein 37 n=1 Tax=Tigriopus californicus TaxID=6832 RepID=A0A553NCG7_TIGCA|nr:WD repeat-containing protein 37-like [Tigriopus californicus]TRY63143.1 hypothetical protein TCAL_00346 [Tigriopus californicus]
MEADPGSRKHKEGYGYGYYGFNRKSSLDRRRGSSHGEDGHGSSSTIIPPSMQKRLNSIFREVEKEFENLYLENLRLREKVDLLERVHMAEKDKDKDTDEPDAFENVLKSFTKKNAFKTRHKLKAHTSKIVSSFKPPQINTARVREYKGHRDGIWDVDVSKVGHPLIATASADKTARIWGIDSGKCLLNYTGHAGSVNSISFHPSQDIALTASGDGTAHVWKASAVPDFTPSGAGGFGLSSEESAADSSEDDRRTSNHPSDLSRCTAVKTPIIALSGHQGVVIGCQWLDDDLAVTAGWDRAAHLYNVETGALMQTLVGHDAELTHVSCHPSKRLVATCSVDTTFRLWDFRETIHSVSVFQGHTEAVTSTAFSRTDQIVSGSDDRSVKVWDLRNMRAPVTSIQAPSAVNRLAVSLNGTIAIPHDNRQVVLYDLQGQKIIRLPRDASKPHNLMVTSVCWAAADISESWRCKANLFSAGFDRIALGWTVRPASKDEKEAKFKE